MGPIGPIGPMKGKEVKQEEVPTEQVGDRTPPQTTAQPSLLTPGDGASTGSTGRASGDLTSWSDFTNGQVNTRDSGHGSIQRGGRAGRLLPQGGQCARAT